MFLFIFISHFLTGFSTAHANTLTLEQVWTDIHKNSPAQEAARLEQQAADSAKSRSSRHWLPRLYLDAKGYRTNDPGASFFGLIQQRSLTNADFDVQQINRPDSQTFVRGALGVDLPLYEGGMKSAQVDVYKHAAVAQQHIGQQVQADQFATTQKAYDSLAVILQQIQKMNSLEQDITKLIKNYQLGSKSNPVGYSGLLGMRSLNNRIQALHQQYKAQQTSFHNLLKELGVQTDAWEPAFANLSQQARLLVNLIHKSNSSSHESYKVSSLKESVKAGEFAAKMETARFLPRVGAFAESYMFHGNRDTADGYMAGVYLQWSLVNPSDMGTVTEARLRAAAAQKQTDALTQQERAETQMLLATVDAVIQNLNLLESSYKLLDEQSRMTTTLFRNGSISALQMVEVLNRKVDLVDQQTQALLQLTNAQSHLFIKHKIDIDSYLSELRKGQPL